MREMEYFGNYQPLDGRISYLFREALKDNQDYYYFRHFSKTRDGISTLIISKTNAKDIYEIKVTTKKTRPAKEPIKEKTKKEIIDIFIKYIQKEKVFTDKELASIEPFSKGISLHDLKEGIIMIDVIKKRKMPE